MKTTVDTRTMKIAVNHSGQMTLNGKALGSQIQMAFRTVADDLETLRWRSDSRERFISLMENAGMKPQGEAIISAILRD